VRAAQVKLSAEPMQAAASVVAGAVKLRAPRSQEPEKDLMLAEVSWPVVR
jgi:hypothetical protein